MKKNKYEKPLVSVVDYELENNIAGGESGSEDGAVVSVTAKGMTIEVTGEAITYP